MHACLIVRRLALLAGLLSLIVVVYSATISANDDIAGRKIFSSGDKQVRLIELFTSQGCSSCPPAEDFVNALKDDPRLWNQIIPLAWHVDYWDYLGWEDQWASPDYSMRQRLYNRMGNLRTVYTPGFVVAGDEWKGFFSRQDLPPGSSMPVPELQLRVDGQAFVAHYSDEPANPMTLHVAVLGFGIVNQIAAGENRGRELQQEFVVLATDDWSSGSNEWQGTLPATAFDGTKAVVAWVSERGQLAPLQAVGGWL